MSWFFTWGGQGIGASALTSVLPINIQGWFPLGLTGLIPFLSKGITHYSWGNGNPLQYSCLENPMDRGAWWAAVHGVAKSRTRLSAEFNSIQFSKKEKNCNAVLRGPFRFFAASFFQGTGRIILSLFRIWFHYFKTSLWERRLDPIAEGCTGLQATLVFFSLSSFTPLGVWLSLIRCQREGRGMTSWVGILV